MRWLAGFAFLVSAVLPSQDEARLSTSLESGIIAALAADDAVVRAQAVSALGQLGDTSHFESLVAAAGDADMPVRAGACIALARIASRFPAVAERAHAVLDVAAQDPNGIVRTTVIRVAELLPRTDWNPIEGLLADPFPEIRAAAAKVLTRHGVRLHDRDVLSLLTDLSDIAYERDLVDVFDLATGREGRALVATFAERSDREVAFRACEALKRLDAMAAGLPDGWWPRTRKVHEQYRRENDAAAAVLARRAVRELAVDDTLAVLRRARLVLVGERHMRVGPLRTVQCAILRAMVAETPGQVWLGYEPSVRGEQQLVLEEASRLGVPVIPLEVSWRELAPQGCVGERDEEAASVINALLTGDASARLLVIRGEEHVQPAGFLARRLDTQAHIVLTDRTAPVQLLDRATCANRTFQVVDDERVFYWTLYEPTQYRQQLAAWLAEQRTPPGRPAPAGDGK